MRLVLSKHFPRDMTELQLGRYTLRSLPTSIPGADEAILYFTNKYKHIPGEGSHPVEEANIVRKLLSIFLNTPISCSAISVHAEMLPGVNTHATYPQFFGEIDANQICADLDRVLCLDDDLARQFIRSSHAYSFALQFIPSDLTFAFFLLVVAIECLSSQEAVIPSRELDRDKKKCERFCHFINTYLPEELRGPDEQDSALFTNLLKTVYHSHRSGFVHGGKEVSLATLDADRVGSSYFKHKTDGQEVRTPGIGWFAGIVRGALLGYLRSIPQECLTRDMDRLSRLAMEKAMLLFKAKRDIQKGEPVKYDDVDYR